MPIASGAAGRVEIGVDTSTAWTPFGEKRRTKPFNRHCDSYLQRYQELKQRQNEQNPSQARQDNTCPRDHENNGGGEEEQPQLNGDHEDTSAGPPSTGRRSKKSALCVLL